MWTGGLAEALGSVPVEGTSEQRLRVQSVLGTGGQWSVSLCWRAVSQLAFPDFVLRDWKLPRVFNLLRSAFEMTIPWAIYEFRARANYGGGIWAWRCWGLGRGVVERGQCPRCQVGNEIRMGELVD